MARQDHDHDHDHDHEHEHEHDHDHDDDDTEGDAERAVRKQIALSQIRQYGDPALRMRANEVESFDDELLRLTERMIGLMHDAEGIGLAATQVGILRRFFVFTDDGEDRVLVNPVLTSAGAELELSEEGCLSLGPVRVPVERPTEVTIEGRDAGGGQVVLELQGLAARVVQHELDHLDGKLVLDRTDPESKREALARLRPKLILSR
jgi:peptide deformylase